MKTLTRTLMLAAALLFAGASWADHHGHDRKGHRDAPDIGGLPAIQHLTRAFRHLDLDEGQKEAIHEELKAMREAVRPLVKQVMESRRELHGLITALDFDEEAVAALASEQGDLTAEITLIVAGAASTALAQLTDEQRSELQALRDKHKARREGRGNRGEGHRERPLDQAGEE